MEKFKNYFIVSTIAIIIYRFIKSEINEDNENIELEEN